MAVRTRAPGAEPGTTNAARTVSPSMARSAAAQTATDHDERSITSRQTPRATANGRAQPA
eukprot:8681555-Lingulodinium_polyedra.AAC.1